MKKKIKYLIPLILISGFPFYFKTVCQSFSWISPEIQFQVLWGALTVLIIGGFSILLITVGLNND